MGTDATIPRSQLGRTWLVLKLTAEGFVEDDAWSLGASIAYFTLFSIAPVLLVVIAVAGMAFGNDAAQGAIADELADLWGATLPRLRRRWCAVLLTA